jgi:heparanase
MSGNIFDIMLPSQIKSRRPTKQPALDQTEGMTCLVNKAPSPRNRRAPSAINSRGIGLSGCAAFALLLIPFSHVTAADAPTIAPSSMRLRGTVDDRFQSYNIEMVEITGGRFWKPYRSKPTDEAAPMAGPNMPQGMDAHLFQYRPPIDLTNPRLRTLAAALGPAYVRVSGTWANTTYFADTDLAPSLPPAGFKGILTRRQWSNVVAFAKSSNAPIVTSFAIGAGTRDANGAWMPDQARSLIGYTHAISGEIAAAEFMNEPNLTAINGAPEGYGAAAYGRDFKLFHQLMQSASPHTMILGPSVAGEDAKVAEWLAASGPGLDAYSYHYYGALSERCGGKSGPETALSEPRLSATDRALAFHRAVRDRFVPGKPIWLTETADAACGGNPWAATFLDTFRYLDQLGRLARASVQVVMHNTLAASDYGLVDENTFRPRPNYWGALLWRRLMGNTVLDAGVSIEPGLHVYAHCQRGMPGGVVVLVINTDRDVPHALMLPTASVRYGLDAANLLDSDVRLNGRPLALGPGDELPDIVGVPAAAGMVDFQPATITFLAIPDAENNACR